MPQIGSDYPVQITFQFNGYDVTATVPVNSVDGNGDRTVDVAWTGPNSGNVDNFVISARLQNETGAEAAIRHFGGILI